MQPQVEVKCFPSEPINALVCDDDGSFIIGGGVSGDIYIWQVMLLFDIFSSYFVVVYSVFVFCY